MNPLYFWLAIWILFIIIEMMTVTLYWLSISIWAFLVTAYVYFNHASSVDIIQFIIFVIISTISVFIFPKFFHLSKSNAKIWLEMYVGKTYSLRKVWDDWKLKIDWVDYLIDEDCVNKDFSEWKKVIIDSYNWTILNVSLVK